MRLPSGLNATLLTIWVCPLRARTSWPVSASHTFAVLSTLPEAMRLPLGLVLRLSRAVAQRLSASQAEHWKWRGREIKLVDGTTVSMPDTQDNWKSFPPSKGQKGGYAFRGRVLPANLHELTM